MGVQHEDRQKPRGRIHSSTINGLVRSSEVLSRRTLNPYYLEQPNFYARLIGNTPPYGIQEVTGASATPSGGITWQDVPSGYSCLACADEVNNTINLASKIAEIEWTETSGQYRFRYPRHGQTSLNAALQICVSLCDGLSSNGLLITVSGPNGFSKTCMTGSGIGGCCSVSPITVPGIYTAVVAGFPLATGSINITTPGLHGLSLCLTPGQGTICFGPIFNQCGHPQAGLTVSGAGSSTVTDGSGRGCICGAVGSGMLTSSGITGYDSIAIPYTIASQCHSYAAGGALLKLSTGYGQVCCANGWTPCSPQGADMPIPNPLNIVDPVFGASTLNYDSVSGLWKGVSNPAGWACFGCIQNPTTVNYEFGANGFPPFVCGLRILWRFAPNPPCVGVVFGSSGGFFNGVTACPPHFSFSASFSDGGTNSPYCGLPLTTILVFQ